MRLCTAPAELLRRGGRTRVRFSPLIPDRLAHRLTAMLQAAIIKPVRKVR